MARSDRVGYSRAQVALHWIIAALVAFQLIVHDGMEETFEARMEGDMVEGGDETGAWVHVVIGLTILALALVRLIIRWRRGTPAIPPEHSPVLRGIAWVTHVLLYALIVFRLARCMRRCGSCCCP